MSVERPGQLRSPPALLASGLASLLAAFAFPSPSAAQITLLVPAETTTVLEIEPGIAEAIRQALGAIVRRVEPSLEDLALAAGCPAAPDDPACVSRIASASGASLVVVERATHDASGYQVDIDLRRGADGRLIREVHLVCSSSADCAARLIAALEVQVGTQVENAVADEPPVAVAPHPTRSSDARRTEPAPPPAVAVSGDAPAVEATHPDRREHVGPPSTRPLPVASSVLFGIAVASSLGAMIAGGVAVGVQQSLDTFAAIVATQPDHAPRLSALAMSRDWALAFGTGLALAGACFAAVGAAMMPTPAWGDGRDPRLRLSLGVDPSGGSISLTGRF